MRKGESRLPEADEAEVRRFCGYHAASGPSPQALRKLETRLTRLSEGDEAVLGRYLHTLRTLEQAAAEAASGLGARQDVAGRRSPAEVADRTALLNDWRRRLCGFLGVPVGAGVSRAGGSTEERR